MEQAMNKPLETVTVNEKIAVCEGIGGSALGHPRIYLRIGESGHVDCPYCGCRFVRASGPPHSEQGQ